MTVRRTLELWGPVVLWMGLIYWLSSIPGLHVTVGILDMILRKSAHVFMFFMLTALLCRSNQETFLFLSETHVIFWSAVGALLYAILDEVHQSFVPHRGPSIKDIGFDTLGIIGAAVLWRFRPALLRLKNSNL